MNNTLLKDYPVYVGFWVDWSYGRIMGMTLTVSRSDANLIIAFVSFFVTIVTTSLWSILSFFFHYWFSTPTPQDTLHNQRQAVLRNNSGPTGTAWTLFQLGYIWRKSPRTAQRIMPLLVTTVALVVGFAIAAGFSSRVARGTEVLLSSASCMIFKQTAVQGLEGEAQEVTWESSHLSISANYAQQCYNTLSPSAAVSNCLNSPYVQQQIPTSVNANAMCPFDPKICAINSSNIILDTGLIDTHVDLGLNAPQEQRIQFRRVLECGPLTTRGYSESVDISANETFSYYYYGSSGLGDYTYLYPSVLNSIDIFKETNDSSWAITQYTFNSYVALEYNGSYNSPESSSNFLVIPELQRNGANVYLIFLSPNAVEFRQPTSDPWYNNSQTAVTMNEAWVLSLPQAIYAAEPASPLACLYREQWCFPGLPAGRNCTPLVGTKNLRTELPSIVSDNATWNRIHWLQNTLTNAIPQIFSVVEMLGSQSLTSRFAFYGATQGPVASNQWQQDVQYWHSITMASIQRAFVDTAIGDVPDIPGAVFSYQNEEERAICSSQKIVSTLHVSFSVLGLAIIGFFGLFIIILSLTIESLSNFILKRFKTHAYSRLEWYSTGTLQLQRLAHEELGIGTWSACDSSIPITHQDTILGVLDIKDTSHPVLRAATQADEVELLKRSQTNSDVSRNTETSVRDAEENNEQIGPDIANDSAPDGEGRAEGHETTSAD